MKTLLLLLIVAIFTPTLWAKEINLKWGKIKGASKYNIQLSKDRSFTNPVLSRKTAKQSYKTNLDPGIYHLRVRSIDKLDRPGKWSQPFRLVVTAPIVSKKKKPESVSYFSKKPKVKAAWKAKGKATSYKVIVKKKGQIVFSEETDEPTTSFEPEKPGKYLVYVRSGYEGFYGKPALVKQIVVKKQDLKAPTWKSDKSEYSHQSAIPFEWETTIGAPAFKLSVYKVEDTRSPASEGQLVKEVDGIRSTEYQIKPLPPGKYIAAVQSKAGKDVSPTSTYKFSVRKRKPIEFGAVDFEALFSLTPIDYNNTVQEANSNQSTETFGSVGEVNGNMWLGKSPFGIKAGTSWGAFAVNGKNTSVSDFKLGLTAKFKLLGAHIKPFAGGRAWTVPVLAQTDQSTNYYRVFQPTLAGPMFGIDILVPFSSKFAMGFRPQISYPVFNSDIGSGSIGNITMERKVNGRAQLFAKYVTSPGFRLVAAVGFEGNEAQWNPSSSNTNPNGDKSRVNVEQGLFTAGIEITDDAYFNSTSSGETTFRKSWFGQFDMTAKYSFTPLNYEVSRVEEPNVSGFSADTSGLAQLIGTGWFQDSRHGVNFLAGWGGLKKDGNTVSYPDVAVKWAYKSQVKEKRSGSEFRNFFGLRLWTVPLVQDNNDNSGEQSFMASTPQLLGITETIGLRGWVTPNAYLDLLGSISLPAMAMNGGSDIDNLNTWNPSFNLELNWGYLLSNDFQLGLGVGYRADRLKYTAENQNTESTAEVSSPVFSLSGTYSF